MSGEPIRELADCLTCDRLCLPDDIPMNTLGELGRTQM